MSFDFPTFDHRLQRKHVPQLLYPIEAVGNGRQARSSAFNSVVVRHYAQLLKAAFRTLVLLGK